MKGMQGILIAAMFGIVGAVCNWFYIVQQADKYERESFIAIDPTAEINLGDRFKREHFQKVEIPKNHLGNLETTAVKWIDLDAVEGLAATRAYFGSEILMHQDLESPAKKELNSMIGKDERVMWLPADSRTFNASHVNPGDEVSFRIPRFARPAAPDGGLEDNLEPGQVEPEEIIGPFRILALGNRKGRKDIRKAAGLSSGAENVIAISVAVRGSQLEPKAQRISEILQLTNFQGVQILLHPAPDKKK